MTDFEIFHQPESRFWDDVDRISFEANNLEQDWPSASNPFIKSVSPGLNFSNVTVTDFKVLIGTLIQSEPDYVFTFSVEHVNNTNNLFNVLLMKSHFLHAAPIQSDNACSLNMAMRWISGRTGPVTVSAAAGATYWVHT